MQFPMNPHTGLTIEVLYDSYLPAMPSMLPFSMTGAGKADTLLDSTCFSTANFDNFSDFDADSDNYNLTAICSTSSPPWQKSRTCKQQIVNAGHIPVIMFSTTEPATHILPSHCLLCFLLFRNLAVFSIISRLCFLPSNQTTNPSH